MRAALLITLLAVGAGACGHASDPSASCAAVGARMFQIAQEALGSATIDDATRRAVSDQLPALRDAFAEVCANDAWAPSVRACLARAADHAALEACEQALTDAQRASLDRAGSAAPAKP
jgi:hypothetical protein